MCHKGQYLSLCVVVHYLVNYYNSSHNSLRSTSIPMILGWDDMIMIAECYGYEGDDRYNGR